MKIIDLRDLDRKVKPTDNFFEYASGGWIKRNPIPASESQWGSFYVLAERNHEALHKILKEVSSKKFAEGSPEQKVSDFFFSAMNTAQINRAGISPLKTEIERIESIKTIEDLFVVLGHLHLLDAAGFWYTNIEQDDKNSKKMVLRLYQHGLGLPDRDYYTRTDARSLDIKDKYVQYITKLLKLSGQSVKTARTNADTILALETRLAHASVTNVEQRDVHKMYNKMGLAKLKRLAPRVPWDLYFQTLGIKKLDDLIVSQPNFIKEVNEVLQNTSLEDFKVYLTFHLISAYAAYLSLPFEKTSFWFYGTVLSGAKKMKPRWKKAVLMVDSSLGEALGKLYVEKHFPPSAKKRMMELIENIRTAYRERIKNLDWMSSATKKKALKKLSSIVYKIGYPDEWRDYSKLTITRDSLAQNEMNASLFESEYEIAKLGKPVDRKEWHMTPPTVNAYYSPNMNEIVFPAGILQPPYFSETADDAVNYGAIGAVIGHELTHGFDDQGSHFDGKGNMKKWWTEEDRKKFEKKAAVLVKQFDSYIALDDLHVNGKLTLGENIADLGGLAIGWDAFQLAMKDKLSKKIDGLTPEQRFFIGFAISERGVYRPEMLRVRVLTDPHSPPLFRVNGPVSNLEEFYKVFGVREGDPLYRPAPERAKIW